MANRTQARNKDGILLRDQQFINEYIKTAPDYNATKAYQKFRKDNKMTEQSRTVACTTASKILRKPEVEAFLEKHAEEVAKRADYNADKWLKDTVDLLDMCMGRKPRPTTITIDGCKIQSPQPVYEFDPGAARATLEMLGKSKYLQLFKLEVEHTVNEQLQEMMNLVKPTLGPPAYRTKH